MADRRSTPSRWPSVAHLTGLALEGAALTAMLAAEALALAELARRREDRYAAWAAVAFAGARRSSTRSARWRRRTR